MTKPDRGHRSYVRLYKCLSGREKPILFYQLRVTGGAKVAKYIGRYL